MNLGARWPQQNPATMRPDMVVIGDSIMQNWSYPESWIRPGVLNHGRGGQTMVDIETYFGMDVLLWAPRSVLIEGGVNDFREGKSLDVVVQSRLNTLRLAKAAGLRVFMGNVIAFNPQDAACMNMNPEKSAQLNRVIAAICNDRTSCTLVDFAGAMGPFDQANYKDCAHPNAAGNARLHRALEVAIQGVR